jgi:hypothetical protein
MYDGKGGDEGQKSEGRGQKSEIKSQLTKHTVISTNEMRTGHFDGAERLRNLTQQFQKK